MKKQTEKEITWTSRDIVRKISVSGLQILDAFIKTGKDCLTTSEIIKALGGKDYAKKTWGALGGFTLGKNKIPILEVVANMGKEKLWKINKKYINEVKGAIEIVKPYFNNK